MEFAVVNNYMGPVATKVMKGYSEEDIRGGDEFKVIYRHTVYLNHIIKTRGIKLFLILMTKLNGSYKIDCLASVSISSIHINLYILYIIYIILLYIL
jgi:hypothetical protein